MALAVVAIVSSSLLQMFVTTSYTNKDAQVLDKLNVIAIQYAETFKNDPAAVYNPNHQDTYYFYNNDLSQISPGTNFYDLSVIPTGAAYMVKSDLPAPTTNQLNNVNDAGFYPDFVGTIDLSQYSSDLTVNIDSNCNISVQPSTPSFTYDSSKITENAIPIKVDYSGTPPGTKRTINVTNASDKEAEFYIFNTNDNSDVTINPVQGISSATYPPINTSSDTEYDLTLTVYKLNEGVWETMFTYPAQEHIYS